VIVDRRYDIQAINNAAREFLSIRTVGIGEDLIHLISPAHGVEIRKGIDGAFRNERPPQAGIELEMTSDAGEQRDIRIMCYPGRNPDGGQVDAVILLVTDITETHATRKKTETELATLRSQIERMVAEKQELVERQKSLIDANSELTKANVELLANNERLVISVEEAQSATEEIETLNEEMQATNEELETVNEELQATVEELNTTNDELEARTLELQDLAVTREAQRQASETTREDLAVALNLVEDAVAALDPTGIVLFANEAYRRLEAAAASGKGTFLLGERPAQLAEIALASTSGQPSDVGFRMNGPEQSTGAYRVTTWTNSRNGDKRTAILRIRRTDG
jgi:two-component system CheB/CheR fusion protein